MFILGCNKENNGTRQWALRWAFLRSLNFKMYFVILHINRQRYFTQGNGDLIVYLNRFRAINYQLDTRR